MKKVQKKLPAGFKRKKHSDGKFRYTKALDGGAEVVFEDDDFWAYDAQGRQLGWTSSQKEAEFMAVHGFPNGMDDASDLSLWLAWNDAVRSGEIVLQDEQGRQFLSLGHRVVMSAMHDEHGFDIELMAEQDFWEAHAAEGFNVLALKIADKPLLLE